MTKPLNLDQCVQAAFQYLTPAKSGFWRWSENFEAIQWKSGSTIVFHSELAEILERLAVVGLPNLDAVLLIIAATKETWKNIGLNDGETILTAKERLAEVAGLADGRKSSAQIELFDALISGLNVVHGLDNDVRVSTEAKRTLVELVLEYSRIRLPTEVSSEALDILRARSFVEDSELVEGVSDATKTGPGVAETSFWSFARDLREGLSRVNGERLRNRRATGLNDKVEAADIEIEELQHPSRLVGELIRELESDRDFFGIARVAKHLESVITLPTRQAFEDDLNLGGVSDITNRGTLDRLLLSELANDDLTLAVRIAVNEAMYIRRESPPREVKQHRLMLLDSGIRMWGVPRAISVAIALALVAQSDENTGFECYSDSSRALKEIDLTTREGLNEHLQRLETELHPGAVISELNDLYEQFEHAELDEGFVDVVIVTSFQAVSDREFLEALSQFSAPSVLLFAIQRDGNVQLFKFTSAGRQELNSIQVDLDLLTQSRKPLIDGKARSVAGLPVALTSEEFPLRLSKAANCQRAWPIGIDGTLALTGDEQLAHWPSRLKGGILIHKSVGFGTVAWFAGRKINGAWYSVISHKKKSSYSVVRFEPTSRDTTVHEFELENVRGFFSHQDSLFAVQESFVTQIDLNDADCRKPNSIPQQLSWVRGRFFRNSSGEWYAVSVTEFGCLLEKVPAPKNAFALVDCQAIEGPLAFCPNGVVFTSDGIKLKTDYENEHAKSLFKRRPPTQVIDVSPSASKILLDAEGAPYWQRLEYEPYSAKLRATGVSCYRDHYAKLTISERHSQVNFRGIAVLESDERHSQYSNPGKRKRTPEFPLVLSLQNRKGKRVDLVFDSGNTIKLVTFSETRAEEMIHTGFEPIEVDLPGRIRFSQVNWPDGSSAILDRRGFLHLKSSNNSIPELALSLEAGCVSGWRSDGSFFGDSYYFQDENVISTLEAFETVQQFLHTIYHTS